MNCWLPRYEYFDRSLKSLHKLNKSENMVIKTWFVINGKSEISNLYDCLNLDASLPASYRSHIWNHCTSSIYIYIYIIYIYIYIYIILIDYLNILID